MADTFLIYLPDPFGVGRSRYALASLDDFALVDPNRLADFKSDLITYEVSTLVDDLRRNKAEIPTSMIDLSEAIRLLTGLSKSDGGEPKWSFWRKIKRHFDSQEYWTAAYSAHESRSARAEIGDEEALLRSLAKACMSLWSSLKVNLADKGEANRFFEIEIPAARIFHYRQFHGIGVDVARVEACLKLATQEKYNSYRNVADHLGVSPTGLNYWNVSAHVPQTEIQFVAEAATGYTLRDQLKISADVSTFAKAFTEFMDASRDVDVLTRLSNTNGRTYPTFSPFGTISSRILVSDPHLQELRRKFRSVIAADEAHRLIYFDYSQFEPGIMASLANDADLIKMYNGGDIYAALSSALFGNANHRDLCKRIFLAFSYGMSAVGISKLILGNDVNPDSQTAMEAKVRAFFDRFKSLTKFKSEKESELLTRGRVSTALGNNRSRKSSGPLSSRERRWATSQAVQGTASLIFKTALIDLTSQFHPKNIVLPIHDAVLMQFPNDDNQDAYVSTVTQVMQNAFKIWCPGISARITHGPFS